MKLRIATRSSELALVQTRWVAAKLRQWEPSLEIEEVHVKTTGDKILDRPLQTVGGKGLFVSEVEAQLVEGNADLAVHSVKDIPGDQELADGFDLISVPEREDIRDALICYTAKKIEDLKQGAVVGTSSLRRACQLRAIRPDLKIKMLRGNVQTRLRKLEEGQFDAILLAAAGLKRLNLWDEDRDQPLDPLQFYPAIGQGALGLEAAKSDQLLGQLLGKIRNTEAWLCVLAERAFLKQLQGNCFVPIAGFAEISEIKNEIEIKLRVLVGSEDGKTVLRDEQTCHLTSGQQAQQAQQLGKILADKMAQNGAKALITETK